MRDSLVKWLVSIQLLLPLLVVCQTTGSCFKIESILVDACGNDEGNNEMARFIVGPNALNSADLSVVWATTANPWGGVCQDASTAQKIATLNATIQACGKILEPVGGILPANSKVLLISGLNFNPANNSFAGLADTIYIIFNCASPGTGNFANAGTGIRTLSMSFSTPAACSESVSYDRSLLTGGDGATVNYPTTGSETYTNFGCNAPFVPLSAAWVPPTLSCSSQPIDLTTTVIGTLGGTFSGTGVTGNILDPSAITGGSSNVTYTVGSGACQITESHTLTVGSVPATPAGNSSLNYCTGDIPNPIIVNGTNLIWYSDSTLLNEVFQGPDYQPSNPVLNNYWVVSSQGSCKSEPLKITLVASDAVQAYISTNGPSVFCENTSVELISSSAVNNTWSTGETSDTIQISSPGTYSLSVQGGCNVATASIVIESKSVTAQIQIADQEGIVPFELIASGNSTNSDTCGWLLNGTSFDYSSGSTYLVNEPGVYSLVYTCSNSSGCTSQDSVSIKVINDKVELIIPDVFTPNGDGVNDFFAFQAEGIKNLNGIIYNRWGQKVFSWDGVQPNWNGNIQGNEATEGVYFYLVEGMDIHEKDFVEKGSLTLIRN
jgi:gliding motility-associated-like protein